MISEMSATSELVSVLNDTYSPLNDSYALVSTAPSDHATCAAVPEELRCPGIVTCCCAYSCLLLTLAFILLMVDLTLIMMALMISILTLLKQLFGRKDDNGTNYANENYPIPPQPRCDMGDLQQDRGHRRHRRSLRSAPPPPSSQSPPPLPPPPSPLPPTVSSLPSDPVVPVTALIACTHDVSSCTASAATTLVTAFAASDPLQDSSAKSSDDRPNRIAGSEFPAVEDLGPCHFRLVGSQLEKLRHVCKAVQHPDSDRSERKGEEDDDIAEFCSVMDPASAQLPADSDDSSKDTKPQQESHRTSKSAKKRTEIPVLVDTPCTARCGKKAEQQSSSNQKGSQRTKVPVFVMPHKLCELGGNSCMIPEGKGNEAVNCGVQYQPGDSDLVVPRSGHCNEATNVEEALIPSTYGAIPFEKNWEQRTPVGQDKREYRMSISGTNCEALLAIDALLEEGDDTVEVASDGKKPAPRLLDFQLPTDEVTGRRM